MKKLFFISLISFLNYAALGQTNVEKKPVSNRKFEILITPKLGFGKINETGNAPLNGFINGGDALISMAVLEKLSISTGFGFFQFDGNRTISGNTSNLTNSYFQIPLKINGDLSLTENKSENILLAYSIGFYGNTLLNQKIETESTTNSNNNLGWNFGFSSQIGLKFKLSDLVNIGFGYESQNDLSKMKKYQIERKINLNSIYFTLGYKL